MQECSPGAVFERACAAGRHCAAAAPHAWRLGEDGERGAVQAALPRLQGGTAFAVSVCGWMGGGGGGGKQDGE